ncbi:MAG: hypothetical protein HUK21_06645 [Fibrobacteraceae bacterium]|nr:hypothetical protein [Fibrobacteraceae bacterium]
MKLSSLHIPFFTTLFFVFSLGFSQEASTEVNWEAEIAMRDSIMVVRDSSCAVEKDSLRMDLSKQKARCESWENSYNTIKKENETCSKALRIAIESKMDSGKKGPSKEDVAMSGGTFLGGVALGMLLFWLLF